MVDAIVSELYSEAFRFDLFGTGMRPLLLFLDYCYDAVTVSNSKLLLAGFVCIALLVSMAFSDLQEAFLTFGERWVRFLTDHVG